MDSGTITVRTEFMHDYKNYSGSCGLSTASHCSAYASSQTIPQFKPPKMFSRITTVLAIAFAVATPAMADHLFTITNNCAQTITPSLTNTGGPFIQLAAIGRGGTVTTSVPEGVSLPLVLC
jgi:hypothetical protein